MIGYIASIAKFLPFQLDSVRIEIYVNGAHEIDFHHIANLIYLLLAFNFAQNFNFSSASNASLDILCISLNDSIVPTR